MRVLPLRNSRELVTRRELAAAHRLAVRDGLNEGTWNHMSAKNPDQEGCLLITPGFTHWSQVRASTLVQVRDDGATVGGGAAPTRPAWIIHGPVHKARPDVACAMHVHAPYITAMSIRRDGLDTRSSQQGAQFHGDVAYLDSYEGVLDDEAEGAHMAEALGDRRVLILRNHGALVVGASVARTYLDVYQLERACMYQILARAGDDAFRMPEEVATRTAERSRGGRNIEHFQAMIRLLDETEPDYAQ